jgi:hypothetical protein
MLTMGAGIPSHPIQFHGIQSDNCILQTCFQESALQNIINSSVLLNVSFSSAFPDVCSKNKKILQCHVYAIQAYGGRRGKLHLFLTLELRLEVSGQLHTLASLRLAK